MERRGDALGGDLEDAVLTAQVLQCLVVHHSKKAFFEFVWRKLQHGVGVETRCGSGASMGHRIRWCGL